jgi:hypothetical protein
MTEVMEPELPNPSPLDGPAVEGGYRIGVPASAHLIREDEPAIDVSGAYRKPDFVLSYL